MCKDTEKKEMVRVPISWDGETCMVELPREVAEKPPLSEAELLELMKGPVKGTKGNLH